MGNVVGGILTRLRDPFVVRRIQESFGVRVCEDVSEEKTSKVHSEPQISNEGLKNRKGKLNDKKRASNGVLSIAARAIKKKRTKRKPIASYVLDSPPSSPEGVTPPGTPPPEPADIEVETYPLLDMYFKFVTLVGYEPFFITCLPFMYWNMDVLVARRLTILWCISIYFGSATKALCKVVRPSSPPAIRLEDRTELEREYGFPSSHAIIATDFSVYWLYMCYVRYKFFFPMLVISLLWMFSVAISRVYLGVHTLLDVMGGAFISLLTMIVMVPFFDWIDALILSDNKYFVPLVILIVVVAMAVYPTGNQWTIDRGDTCAIVGATLGVVIGCHGNGPHSDDLLSGPFTVNAPTSQEMGYHTLRYIIGVLLVFPTRFVMKLLCFRLLPAIMPDQGILEVQKRPLVEVPYKLITYTSLGFTMAFVCPIVFEICQVARL